MNTALLKELCEARGVPGQEEAIRRIVRRELNHLTDEMRVDPMGNLYATFPGASDAKIMIAAHMDEIGFIIKHIDDKGFLRLQPLGGFDPRQLFAQRVLVSQIDGGVVPGVLCYATKPPHLLTTPDKNAPELDSFFVDTGLKVDEVKEKFEIGGMVTLDRGFAECGQGFAAKSLDNRVGVFVMIEALRKLEKNVSLPWWRWRRLRKKLVCAAQPRLPIRLNHRWGLHWIPRLRPTIPAAVRKRK